jgi:hypothetical protein
MPKTRRITQKQQDEKDAARRHRKMRKTRKAGKWPQFVKMVYGQMKKKDKSATFMQAMKEASRRKKAGQY